MDIYTAITIGLIGSLHCIGMCGPIAISLPLRRNGIGEKLSGVLLYNGGRTITYGLMGAFFGLLGKGIAMAGIQQWVSILLGAIMIVSILFPVLLREKINISRLFGGYGGRLINSLGGLFSNSSYSNLFLIGLLNGLLPCGLVYVAVAGAINTGAVIPGVVFMILFGLATIPVMAGVSMAGDMIGGRVRKKLARVVPAFIVILGILFILRGLSLGIPYISPKSQMLTPHKKQVNVESSCCGSTTESFR